MARRSSPIRRFYSAKRFAFRSLLPALSACCLILSPGTTQAQQQAAPASKISFNKDIRPILSDKCFFCHGPDAANRQADLRLDDRAVAVEQAAAIRPDQPDASPILERILSEDPDLQMPPPHSKLDPITPEELQKLRNWIAEGAVYEPHWSFLPPEFPAEKGTPASLIDEPIRRKLATMGRSQRPSADRATLLRRLSLDLIGLPPTPEELTEFLEDPSPDAYAKQVDRLLNSPRYAERMAVDWLDVARYSDSFGFQVDRDREMWRWRDWVLQAFEKNMPFDQFIQWQVAGDMIENPTQDSILATAFQRLHQQEAEGGSVEEEYRVEYVTDRVQTFATAFLGLTFECARCHDHKFDPIPTKDYYGLAGVFASTARTERPLFAVEPAVEARYLWVQRRLIDLRYSANLLTNEASTVVGSEQRVAKWKAEIEKLKTEVLTLQARYPALVASLERYWTPPEPRAAGPRRRGNPASTEPFMNAVYDAAQYVDGSDAHYTFLDYRPGEARDVPVFRNGNVATPGEMVPRHFLSVLARGDTRFGQGSGRRELAERIFTDAAPLAARVMVNRVWGWHFGRPLAATASDFGVQGEAPTHPELLTYLAAEFVAHGWSLKWLNREIMTSAAYQQASRPRPGMMKADPTNTLLWRVAPRRMDIEAYRDTLLRASGRLDHTAGGPSKDLDAPENVRRTVYGRVSRNRLSALLKNYDFPDPMQSSGGRDLTTTSLQQLFVLNSQFVQDAAAAIAKAVHDIPTEPRRLRELYRRLLGRDPNPAELDLARRFLAKGTLTEYAHVLLSTNEEILWP